MGRSPSTSNTTRQRKVNMFYDLSDPLDRKRFKLRTNDLFAKERKVELTEKKKSRTIKQNAYLHLIFGWYALETGYTTEEVKQDIFKREICFDLFMRIKKNRQVFKSTSELDTQEMTIAIDMFRNHAANDLNIYLPGPNEQAELRSLEEQLKKYGNRQYI